MKSKRIIRMMFSFLISILVFCTLVVIIISVTRSEDFTLSAILDQVASSFLYIIGYDSLYNDNWIIKCALAIVGILTLSLLSAYLTVLFLYRTDVKICPKIFVWQDIEGYYYCSILVKNFGKAVCNLHMSISLYNCNETTLHDENKMSNDICERYRPILLKKGLWCENFIISPVESVFFFKTFQHFVKGENYKLYVLWSIVDETTGQETTHMQPYDYNDCTFEPPIWEYKKTICTNFQDQFEEFICKERHVIPLKNAIPINAVAIRLNHIHLPSTQRDAMTMEIDYSDVNLNMIEPEFFVMASVQFMHPENWEIFFDEKWEFQFEMFGDADKIEIVTIEIKKKEHLEKVLWREFKVAEQLDSFGPRYSIPLCADGLTREDFQEIKEVDFTVFFKHMKNKGYPSGSVTIVDCTLAKHIEVEPVSDEREESAAMAVK